MSDKSITFDPWTWAESKAAPHQHEVYALARDKGFHQAHNDLIMFLHRQGASEAMIEHARATWVAARLALIHSEVSEALGVLRSSAAGSSSLDWAAELADVSLRLKDLAEDTLVDLGDAEHAKHEFNKTRPLRHGGKVL